MSMQNYEFLKFELENCVNSEVEGKRQKLDYDLKVWIMSPNAC